MHLSKPEVPSVSGTRIAIVGMGGIFPGCASLDEFWTMIRDGRDASREPLPGRWTLEPDAAYDPRPGTPDRVYSKRACYLDPAHLDIKPEDEDGLPPGLLAQLDPLFRIVVKAGRAAWRSAVTKNLDRRRAGVILGNIALPTEGANALCRAYLGRAFKEKVLGVRMNHVPDTAPHPLNRYVTGLPAGVLAHALGLGGGSFTLDAACASSLYAIKLACDDLQAGRADVLLAGGAARPDGLYTQMGFAQLRALSPSGTCAPFDAKGDGLVVGEGACLFVLKRLDDAVAQDDKILAVLHGIGLSNDMDGSLLVPHSEGQLRAMRAAYREAGWTPERIGLVECHATGTPVGDAVEFGSLQTLWNEALPGVEKCVLGSVKSNIGHLLTGAGAAGLAKVLLSLQHETLPPTAHFEHAGAKVDLQDGPFEVLAQAKPWPKSQVGLPRRAAVSAFGFGGINAHLLLEEWSGSGPEAGKGSAGTKVRVARTEDRAARRADQRPHPVAIVGMDARFGPWQDLRAFQERVLGGGAEVAPSVQRHWWGLEESDGYARAGLRSTPFAGYYIHSIEIRREALRRFRIPPKEFEEMLSQQVLMLLSAAAALDDAGMQGELGPRAGIFVGLGLDHNTTNFQLRWSLPAQVRAWNEQYGLRLKDEALRAWTERLCEAVGPALNANRTLGALGGIVASRLAREFRCGGPSFGLSSEESSSLRALERAVRALQLGEIDRALVGAVDLSGDPRAVLAMHASRPFSKSGVARPLDAAADGALPGEGAATLVLKRLDDAQRDGDRVYAVITGLGSASGGALEHGTPDTEAYAEALRRAHAEARVTLNQISFLETHGSGIPAEDALEARALCAGLAATLPAKACALGSVKADIGHAGAAAGLASLVKVALALYQNILPPLGGHARMRAELAETPFYYAPSAPQFWLRDRAEGPRRAGVSAFSVDGNCVHCVLEGLDRAPPTAHAMELNQPLGAHEEALFTLEADDDAALAAGLRILRGLAEQHGAQSVEALARSWFAAHHPAPGMKLGVALRASSPAELLRFIASAESRMRENPTVVSSNGKASRSEKVFFTREPLGRDGKLAFIFPGSGNHFAGMGRASAAHWPSVPRRQDAENARLRSQLVPHLFWNETDAVKIEADARALIFGQVAVGSLMTDVLEQFGVRPALALGYSLGESAGFFALRAWTQRDEMLRRMTVSPLFTHELAGPCEAARRAWKLSADESVDWMVALVPRPADGMRAALAGRALVYVLIANTPGECVIGGQRSVMEQALRELGVPCVEISGCTVAHCAVLREVEQAYRELHGYETHAPAGIAFYSGAWGRTHEMSRASAAETIVAHALHGLDFTKVVERAYADGARMFVEVGPGGSCTRMLGAILEGRPHVAKALCTKNQSEHVALLDLLGALVAHRVPLNLAPLYGGTSRCVGHRALKDEPPAFKLPVGGAPFTAVPLPPPQSATDQEPVEKSARERLPQIEAAATAPATLSTVERTGAIARQFAQVQGTHLRAHEAFLRVSQDLTRMLAQNAALQRAVMERMQGGGEGQAIQDQKSFRFPDSSSVQVPQAMREDPSTQGQEPRFMTRAQCLAFARGKIGDVLGRAFAEIDAHPTRVRLPDEPLMLVDRILSIEGAPRSMTHGRVITEHDVFEEDWYLDQGRMPVCIAVESGQADLFLSGYLGIDFQTHGLACYRLLDAAITFHAPLPGAGSVVRYDLRIERFFRQGETWLFHFNFEGTVDGRPLLSMSGGCAGFFTQQELAAGQGIVHTALDKQPLPGKRPADWRALVPLEEVEAYTDRQVDALRCGAWAACFGPAFETLNIRDPLTLPGGRMKLIDRVVTLDPRGGRYGMGQIRAQADLHSDDWFLTCHFVDDMVMPGTLMYECCLHTLRVYLMRMGWVCERAGTAWEPVPGVSSKLKCRGQVLASTKLAEYEITIKELGYDPAPYALADALMYADGRPIVAMTNMSLRLSGVTYADLERLWTPGAKLHVARPSVKSQRQPALYDHERILAFAVGKPSDAFGEPYRVFDSDRVIARLPGPPYQFLDRITVVQAEAWKMQAGGRIEAQYDVPFDAWYFAAQRSEYMPFAVLLEIALQPCGWFAAYMGSALTSGTDLSFRNLGGSAVKHRQVGRTSGTLTTEVAVTKVSSSGGMIIQHYDFTVRDALGVVYAGNTYFGFFSKQALARQVGLRDAKIHVPGPDELAGAHESFPFPAQPPYPDAMLRMVDHVDCFVPTGGPAGLGFIEGRLEVDPSAWFFKAHFHQDPVMPGSLGLEALLQLLKVVALERWGAEACLRLEALPSGTRHEWTYRGQVIPTHSRMTVQASITHADAVQRVMRADGILSIEGGPIYALKDFAIKSS